MADGRDGSAPGFEFRRAFPWADIFRCFQVALDPRKLLVAAVGIFAMSFGWWLLSVIFWKPAYDRSDSRYSNTVVQKEYQGKKKADGTDYNEADLKEIGDKQHARDMEEWRVLDRLAGPDGGKLRTMPWSEYRGPNPYLLVTGVIGGNPEERRALLADFLTGSVPVLVEPLAKLLIPVSNLVSPNSSFWTRF